ncbi:MAG: tryptophan synthase subunit alpha [Gemmataceae bacterium]|nr:tryptophan synthase subunit alpha [Gemmataceae bacterium]
MNPIDQLFQKLRAERRKAFIPFITAGDPSLAATAAFVRKLAESGASLVEIGFPYSDPIADGPIIQASYTRALERGIQVDPILATSRQMAGDPALAARGIPLVGMVSYSLVHRRGPRKFLEQAQAAGYSGAIVPDLPLEESESLARLAAALDFKLIHLVTPTTPMDRAARIARLSTGFLYCVSVTGVTGERDRLPDQVLDQLRRLRKETDVPLCVGFGISKPEHVQMLREEVDGVIVGSAFVRRLAEAGTRPLEDVVNEMGALAKLLVTALNPL